MKSPETRLAQRLNNKEEQAFRDVYNLYKRRLFTFLVRFAIDREDAKEIVSDAFVALVNRVRQNKPFDDEKHINNFLFEVVRNAAINQLRPVKGQAAQKDTFVHMLLESEWHAYNQRVEAELLQNIYSAAERLPEKCKTIFKMHYLENLGFGEIAARLGLSTQTVRNQKSRAIQLLRQYICQSQGMVMASVYTTVGILLTLTAHCLPLL
jgi:RNA polymerase sigma-70 factor (ECF subfamily)